MPDDITRRIVLRDEAGNEIAHKPAPPEMVTVGDFTLSKQELEDIVRVHMARVAGTRCDALIWERGTAGSDGWVFPATATVPVMPTIQYGSPTASLLGGMQAGMAAGQANSAAQFMSGMQAGQANAVSRFEEMVAQRDQISGSHPSESGHADPEPTPTHRTLLRRISDFLNGESPTPEIPRTGGGSWI